MLSSLLIVTLLAVTIFYLAYFWKIGKESSKFPPVLGQLTQLKICMIENLKGPPFCLPILGHLPFLGSNPPAKLLQWSYKYGPIISIQLGSFRAIVINEGSLLKQAFNRQVFAGRPCIKFFDDASRNRQGLLLSDGPHVQEQRKFIRKKLKGLGYGGRSMESRILGVVPSFLEIFENHLEKPLDVKHMLSGIFLNGSWGYIAGKSVDKNDGRIKEMIQHVSRLTSMTNNLEKASTFVSFLSKMIPEMSGFKEKMKSVEAIQDFLEWLIEEHGKTKIKGEPRDLIDAYLDQAEEAVDSQSSPFATRDNITITMQDLFIGATETTVTGMEWLLYYLVKYPKVQEKMQEEIDSNLNPTLLPSSDDRSKLPYTEAVIEEALRKSAFLPMALFHSSLEDTELNGFQIPKNTMVIGNIYAVQNRRDVWGDPEVFRPERFLDLEGKFLRNNENVMIFSHGKRKCLGEALARLQLFLFTVVLFQGFELRATGELPSEEGIFGFNTTVFPFQVNVRKRETNFDLSNKFG